MIRSICFYPDSDRPKELPVDQVKSALRNVDNLIWIDLSAPTQEELFQVLQNVFHFHPLAIEDCLHNGWHTPKIDDFGSYIFLIGHAIDAEQPFPYIFTNELDLFLGANYIVTHSTRENIQPVAKVWDMLSHDERLHHNGSDFLCHAVMDALVDAYVPVLEKIEDEVELLEDRLVARPTRADLERVLALKHSVLSLRRLIGPMRDTVNRLSRDPFSMIDLQSKIYFRDVYDHLVRLEDSIDLIRDLVSSAQEMYVNSMSMRMNEVMKALTVVATIFLPLSWIAGVYGMNFRFMPEIDWRFGYPFAWLLFIAVAAGMLLYFRRKGWF